LDLLILGGYYGDGTRRSGRISHFLMGVLHQPYNPKKGEGSAKFDTICKVGTGYNLDELAMMNSKMKKVS
jgi:DNA ligase-4